MILAAVFDTRELAIVVWLVILAGCVVVWPKTRPSVGSVLRTAASRQIASILALMVLYVAAVVFALLKAGVWTNDMIGGTVFWFFGPATILFFRVPQAGKDPHFFRRVLRSTLRFTAVVGFLVNLYPLSFLAEFLLLPVFALLGCLLVVAATKPEFKPVKALVNGVVVTGGVVFFVYGLYRVTEDPGHFATMGTLQGFLLPAVLTTAFFPFLYALGTFMIYDGLFTWLRLWLLREDDGLRRRARRRLLRACGPRLSTARRAADAPWIELLSVPPTDRDIDQIVRHVKSGQPNALATSVATEEALARIADARVPGWEYSFFAERLHAGQLVLAARHEAFDCDSVPESFDKARDRAATGTWLDEKMTLAVGIVEELNVIFAEEAVAEAFGAPGEPGDPQLLRRAAEAIITVYDQLLSWAETVGALKTVEECRPLVHAASQMMRRPLDQIRDYVAKWSRLAEDLPRRIEEASRSSRPVRIKMSLALTIDPKATKRLKKEVAQLVGS
jgi:hypothetical protein